MKFKLGIRDWRIIGKEVLINSIIMKVEADCHQGFIEEAARLIQGLKKFISSINPNHIRNTRHSNQRFDQVRLINSLSSF